MIETPKLCYCDALTLTWTTLVTAITGGLVPDVARTLSLLYTHFTSNTAGLYKSTCNLANMRFSSAFIVAAAGLFFPVTDAVPMRPNNQRNAPRPHQASFPPPPAEPFYNARLPDSPPHILGHGALRRIGRPLRDLRPRPQAQEPLEGRWYERLPQHRDEKNLYGNAQAATQVGVDHAAGTSGAHSQEISSSAPHPSPSSSQGGTRYKLLQVKPIKKGAGVHPDSTSE
jgi:hypothetical protein